MEFRCKSCGTQLNFLEGKLSARCESCGNTYMIFDFLDKDSSEYQERMRIIKTKKEEYDVLYQEYADDILEADSYCLTSTDFSRIIDFFESAEKSENTIALLKMAKIQFIKRVSSYSECQVAIRYVDEVEDSISTDKSDLVESLTKLALKFKHNELVDAGLAIPIPQAKSPSDLLLLFHNMLTSSNSQYQPNDKLENDIINKSKCAAVEYINDNAEKIVLSATSVADLTNIQKALTNVSSRYGLSSYQELCKCITSKIALLSEIENIKENKELKQQAKEKARQRKKKLLVTSIVASIIVALIGYITFLINGYSADNVILKTVSKTNEKFNENLTPGNINAGYFYTFAFDINNKSPYDITLIRGNMEIFNSNGVSLSTSSVEIKGELLKGTSVQQNIQLKLEKGNHAREIWNTDLDGLKITFRIKNIYFLNGTKKTYRNTRNEVIHAVK